MTATVQTLRREVQQLHNRKPPSDLWLELSFPFTDTEPHGTYGSQAVNVITQEYRTVSEEEEVQRLTTFYHQLPPLTKRDHDGYSWATLEQFLESHRCKCGNFGHAKV